MSFLPTPPSQKRVSFYSSSNGGQNGNSNNNNNSMTSNNSNNINGTISISEKDLKRLSRYDYYCYLFDLYNDCYQNLRSTYQY